MCIRDRDIKGGVPGFSSYICRFTDPSELVCVTLTANKEGVDPVSYTHLDVYKRQSCTSPLRGIR